MANISISDLYRGEGPGEKYGGILNAVFHEIFTKGIPGGCSEQTWIELLTVKHTFLVAERMKTEGDVVSELSEAASPFCCAETEGKSHPLSLWSRLFRIRGLRRLGAFLLGKRLIFGCL